MIVQRNSSVGTKDENANGVLIGNFGNVEISNAGMVGMLVYYRPYLVSDGFAIDSVRRKGIRSMQEKVSERTFHRKRSEFPVPNRIEFIWHSPIAHARTWRLL